jgi:hypothetical protein
VVLLASWQIGEGTQPGCKLYYLLQKTNALEKVSLLLIPKITYPVLETPIIGDQENEEQRYQTPEILLDQSHLSRNVPLPEEKGW